MTSYLLFLDLDGETTATRIAGNCKANTKEEEWNKKEACP